MMKVLSSARKNICTVLSVVFDIWE